MITLPEINFDSFNLAEIPTFILCNPNKEELYALGGISERKLSVKFNAISELSFRADKTIDETDMPYYLYLTTKRLVYIKDFGYFMITEADESDDGIVKYKEIKCQSLETELSAKKLVLYISGSTSLQPESVFLSDLLDDLIDNYIPDWSWKNGVIKYVSGSPADTAMPDAFVGNGNARSFDIGETSIYNFLMTSIEEAYGCVFDFDTVNKKINIYDPNEIISQSNIYISHNNLIKMLNVKEITDELVTCLYVAGGGGLNITAVNPLGNNYIYNFQYFKSISWMAQDLIDAITSWENLIEANREDFYGYAEQIVLCELHIQETNATLEELNAEKLAKEKEIEAAEEAGLPTEQLELELAEIINNIANYEDVLDFWTTKQTYNIGQRNSIINLVSFENNFTVSQLLRLQPFIIQGSYINENIIVTDSMSVTDELDQGVKLLDQAILILDKNSQLKYTFEIDSVNFMHIKDFQIYRDQISLGTTIMVELEEGISSSPVLLQMDMGIDDPTDFKLIFGNRARLDDESFKFGDLLTKALSGGTKVSAYSPIWNSWATIYHDQFVNLNDNVQVNNPGYGEGVFVNNGNINLMTPDLLWNGQPISSYINAGVINNITITLFSAGGVQAMYPSTTTGLLSALAAALSGDVIFLPDVDITGNFGIPAGVSMVGVSRKQSIIRGTLALEEGSSLETLTLSILDSSSAELIGVNGPSAGKAYLNDVFISVTNNGSGNAYGIRTLDGDIEFKNGNSTTFTDSGDSIGIYTEADKFGSCHSLNSDIKSTTNSGNGWAFKSLGGSIYAEGGSTEATTSPIGA